MQEEESLSRFQRHLISPAGRPFPHCGDLAIARHYSIDAITRPIAVHSVSVAAAVDEDPA